MENKFKTGNAVKIVNHRKAKLLGVEAVFETYGEGHDCIISVNNRRDKYVANVLDLEPIEPVKQEVLKPEIVEPVVIEEKSKRKTILEED